MVRQIKDSSLLWRDNAPVAPDFDDVYYSAENGLEESRYVFLHGNSLPDGWKDKAEYVIAETGFGTGLNFLATWQAWKESGARGKLVFVSTEAFPLTRQALEEAHATFPEVSEYAEALRAAWPPPSDGSHLLSFEAGKIELLLLFGMIENTLPALSASVDAWYLDGFAPAKNPDMWNDTVLDQIARLSKPGTRFATFTAAGFVRRGLIERGFEVQKVRGYGRKRERLIGELVYKSTIQSTFVPEWAQIPTPMEMPQTAIIIGGGIAGASTAYSLRKRGLTVTIIANTENTESVPVAIVAPGLQRTDSPAQHFAIAAFAHATSFGPYKDAWCKNRGVDVTGTTTSDMEKLLDVAEHLDWPEDWLQKNEGGFHLPTTGSLDTKKAISALKKDIHEANAQVTNLKQTNKGWTVKTNVGDFSADCVVIAAGAVSNTILASAEYLPIRPKPGQSEFYEADTSNLPNNNISFGGYVTSSTGFNGKSIQSLGSTFEQEGTEVNTEASYQSILQKYQQLDLTEPNPKAHAFSWRGIRATLPDHLPLVGPVPDWDTTKQQFAPLSKDARILGLGTMPYQKGLYIMAGFGSKGFQQAPYCAEYLASLICGPVRTLLHPVMAIIHPARFLIRNIIKGQP